MQTKQELKSILTSYLSEYESEVSRQKVFSDYLDRNVSKELYSRKNFDGHITASAFILNESHDQMLLIHHKFLQKWLQPGGHVEQEMDTDILDAVYREILEETGIDRDQLTLLDNSLENIPFDIDSHAIPPNDKKQEDGHDHHDFRYLFRYSGDSEVVIDPDESLGFQWFSLESLLSDEIFRNLVPKIIQRLAR